MLKVGDLAVYANTAKTIYVHSGDIVEILSMRIGGGGDKMVNAFPLKWVRYGTPPQFRRRHIFGKTYIPLKLRHLSPHGPACMFDKGGHSG